jgi:DNA-binding NarL/FixJ family response regulator
LADGARRAGARTLAATDPATSMHLLQTYLVEDSPLIRDSLIATLQELAPVQVVGACDAEDDALRWLRGHAVDLVIVDLFLKGGSGLGVLRATTPGGPRHVVLSNYATAAMRARCLALGADRVFDKSTEIDGLIAYCERLARAPEPLAPAR